LSAGAFKARRKDSVTVTIYGVKGAGEIIDAAANAVGDAITFNGISLSIGDNSSRSLIAPGGCRRGRSSM